MSLSERNGLCLSPPANHHKVTTFKPFYLNIDFPQSLVQFEQTAVTITVFNYYAQPQQVRIALLQDATTLRAICTDNSSPIYLDIGASSSLRHSFPIMPLRAGLYQIKFEASTEKFKHVDTVVRNLTVVAPGIERMKQVSFDVDPLNRAGRQTVVQRPSFSDVTEADSQRISVDLLASKNLSGIPIVPQTLHYIITAMGERFSPTEGTYSIEGLPTVMPKLKSSGTRNTNYLAYNLFAMKYLNGVDRLTPEMRTKGARYLTKALVRALTFRQQDGSYIPFIYLNESSASVWMTALVTKVICQSQEFIGDQIDPLIVTSALNWISARQKPDGRWQETESAVYVQRMSEPLTLSAYILLTLHECKQFSNATEMSEKAVKMLRTRLDTKQIEELKPFSQALIAYSLAVNEQVRTDQEMQTKITDLIGALQSSTKLELDSERNLKHWQSDYPVETTAYALMALLTQSKGENLESLTPVVNWLSASQKPQGATFDSTQDTIVALEAQAQFYSLYHKQLSSKLQNAPAMELYMNVTVKSKQRRVTRSLFFDSRTVDLVRTVDVGKDAREIAIESRGNGQGKVNLHVIYNEYHEEDLCAYNLTVKLERYSESAGQRNAEAVDENANQNANQNEKPQFSPNQELSNNNNLALVEWCRSNVSRIAKRTAVTDFDPLPSLNDPNPALMTMHICVRHLRETSPSEIALLEVGLLSGYEPIGLDLERLKRRFAHLIVQYEISGSRIVFYLHTVPNASQMAAGCFAFRMHKKYEVQQQQSGLVRIYNQYSNGWACSRLYSDLTATRNLDKVCSPATSSSSSSGADDSKQLCKCVSTHRCPRSDALRVALGEGDAKGMSKKRRKHANYKEQGRLVRELFCQYSSVSIGTVEQVINNADQQEKAGSFIEWHVTMDTPIVGDFHPKLIVRRSAECANYGDPGIENGSEILILHTPDLTESGDPSDSTAVPKWHLDGQSVVMSIAANRRLNKRLNQLRQTHHDLKSIKCDSF